MLYKKHKYDLIVVGAVLALSISIFLAVSEANNVAVPCGITGGCERVLTSRYAHPFGLPLPYVGIMFSSALILSGLLANYYQAFRKIIRIFLGLGAVFALIFLYLQFFVIHSVCQYCLLVDSLTIAMFLWDLNVEYKEV